MSNSLDDLSEKLHTLVLNYNTLNDLPPWVRNLTADLLKRNITIETWNHYVKVLQQNSADIQSLNKFLTYLGEAINTSLSDTITVNNVVVKGKFYIGDLTGEELIAKVKAFNVITASEQEGCIKINGKDVPVVTAITEEELNNTCV